jgi:hypothetical protein
MIQDPGAYPRLDPLTKVVTYGRKKFYNVGPAGGSIDVRRNLFYRVLSSFKLGGRVKGSERFMARLTMIACLVKTDKITIFH